MTEAAEDLGLPTVVALAAADEITERGLLFTFRLCAKAEWYARDQVRFLVDLPSRGGPSISSVTLLHEDGPFGETTAASQKDHLERAGIAAGGELTYPADQADLHQEILAIKSDDTDAVLTATFLEDALLMGEAASGSHLSLPVIDAGGGFMHADFIPGLGDAAEGLLSATEYVPGTSAQRLEQRFQDEYGSRLTAGALYSYQAVWVLADALERAGSTDGESLRTALAATAMTSADHLVLPQSLLTFDGTGQNGGARLFVAQVQDGRWVPIWPAAYAQAGYRP